MHIALVGPIATADVAHLLRESVITPHGYAGAPLMGVLASELVALGHRVTAITTDASLPMGNGNRSFSGQNFTFVLCPARPHAWRFNGWLPGRAVDFFAAERRAVRNAIGMCNADVVHAHWSYEFALAALGTFVPHLITCHDSPKAVLRLSRSPYRAVRYLMAKRVFKCAANYSTVSKYMVEELDAEVRRPMSIIPNPVSTQALLLGSVRERPDTRRIAMVSNGWDDRKNSKRGFEAFSRWRAKEPLAEMHVFGTAFGLGGAAHQWALNHKVASGVHFRGTLPHAKLLRELSTMDALLHPALEESFGVVLAEAMALGIPVVAGFASGAVPDVMGADETGNCTTGLLVDPCSTQAMATGLAGVFSELYRQMSEAARARAVAYFSPQRVAKMYEDRYIGVLRMSLPTTSLQK